MEIISIAIPFIVVLLLGFAIPSLLVLSYIHYSLGIFLIAIAFLVDTITMGAGGINVGLNLFYPDLFLGMIALVAGLRLGFAKDAPSKNLAWMIFCVIICVSTITGLVSFGTAAGVSARQYFYFMVASAYTMSFDMSTTRLRQTYATIVWTAFFLVGIAVYRWVVYYTPIASLLPPGGTYNIDGPIRVIYSNHALVLAEALIGGIFFAAGSRGFSAARVAAPFLLAAVLALQHRSVWLAAIVGVMIRLFLGRSNSGSTLRQVLLLVLIVGVTAVPMAFNSKLSGVTEQIGSSAQRAFEKGGTGGERLQSWQGIVHNWYAAGVKSIVIGQSFGADNTRYVVDSAGKTRKIKYIAHNLYVQNLFNLGALGLCAFLLANLIVIRRLHRIVKQTHAVEAEIFLVIIAMQLAYYIPYGVDFFQALIFGAAMAYAAHAEVKRKPALQPDIMSRRLA